MKFSLIVPTLGRKGELIQLLDSICRNNYKNYEVIIVDQNQNDLIDDVVSEYKCLMSIRHEKVDFRGAAQARNHGVKFSTGEIINFPDDDSELSIDTLEKVVNKFKNEDEIEIVFGRTVDKETGKSSVVKFLEESTYVTERNLYFTSVECTMFILKEVFNKVGGFDSTLGVGSFYGSEEGADFVLRALYEKRKITYDPKIIFFHPEKVNTYNKQELDRAFSYGKGFGRLSCKHYYMFKKRYALQRYIVWQVRAICGIFLFLLKRDWHKMKYYINVIKGRWVGYKMSKEDFINKTR
ncbi:glycosyltransferase family 2 protein [Bacillus mobilis]|uniref:glycosyltransferase family 2 protein n=1 Tax=Bacillus mobilis TaxID=2026190 RepID=UPI0021D0A3E8|nr:glycosyltransferase family A protein [Bacillus mobilis]MCU5198149.1 glycosyltransferase family 2 protein [Bacillus mobilis]